MFDRFRDDLTEPERFARGPLAVKVAGAYLTLVVLSFVVLVVSIASVGNVRSGGAAVPLLILTAPLSLTCAQTIGNVFYPVPPLVGAVELLVYGVVIAWWLWRVVRGGRYVDPDRADH
jgi:hypothetical protein